MKDETAASVTKHLIETYQQYAAGGIIFKRVLTNNGSGYKSKMFKEACQTLNVKHRTPVVRQKELYRPYSASGLTRDPIPQQSNAICFWNHSCICITTIDLTDA